MLRHDPPRSSPRRSASLLPDGCGLAHRGIRRPVVAAFVFAKTFVLGCPFLIGPAPHATAAQSATTAVASAVPESGDFAGLVDIGGRNLYLE
jgi:hypothetical protein